MLACLCITCNASPATAHSLTTTQRYLHPARRSVTDAGALLSKHLQRSTGGPQSGIV
jgi:hypothetical protein